MFASWTLPVVVNDLLIPPSCQETMDWADVPADGGRPSRCRAVSCALDPS